jgi:hypothetical protein
MIKKDDGWFMMLPYNKKIFIVKAGSSELSSIELKALAVDLSSFMHENISDKKKETQIVR